jgi:predicted nucleotidyltransferase
MTNSNAHIHTAQLIANEFAQHSVVSAITLGGSVATNSHNLESDIDLYIYATAEVPITIRQKIASRLGKQCEINNQFWETGDEWVHGETNIHVDIMFRDLKWIESQLQRVTQEYQASVGYTTCFWANVAHSKILFDRNGWFESLQKKADIEYPKELKTNIWAKNFPILATNHSSYVAQIQKALKRKDTISINHRLTEYLASYFDILLAINEQVHPGEKRLQTWINTHCKKIPDHFNSHLNYILVSSNWDDSLPEVLTQMAQNLEKLVTPKAVSNLP